MSETEFLEEEYSGQINSGTVLRILKLTRQHWPWLAGFLITIGLTSAVDSYFTFLGKRIIDEGILAGDIEALLDIAKLYGGVLLFQAFNVLSFIYLAGVLGQRIQYDLRKNTFNHLQELSLSYFDRTPIGWIMSRVTSDSERIAQLVTWGLLDVTWAILIILSSMFFMIRINWRLTLIVGTVLPALIIVAAQFKKHILGQFRLVRSLNSRITAAYNEHIVGVRVIKALNREEQSLHEFQDITDEMYNAGYRAAWLSALFLPTVIFISSFALGGIAYFGGGQLEAGALTIGGIQAFVGYIALMLWPVQDIARVYAEMQHSKIYLRHMIPGLLRVTSVSMMSSSVMNLKNPC
jgi:ATP-binding cassette subfamily B protein